MRALTAGVKRTAPVYVVASTSLRDPTASVPPLRSCRIQRDRVRAVRVREIGVKSG